MRSVIEPVANLPIVLLLAVILAGPIQAGAAQTELVQFSVTSLADSGPGSLRWALEEAALRPELPVRIDFGDRDGLFSQPQRIELESPLPPIVGTVEINGFIRGLLWRAYGATIGGGQQHRLFEVLPGARLTLTGITLSHGQAEYGGAILNQGELIVEGVSLFRNQASQQGGAIDNRGRLYLVNSTLAWNEAEFGGAIASSGSLDVVNATVYLNRAEQGAGLWNSGDMHLVNSILAGDGAHECHNQGELSDQSSHNLIHGDHHACGTPILSVDPRLEALGYFNGPTQVFPIGRNSPVVNLGLSEAAMNVAGQRLTWDQRGNGDPRFASGFTDLGAFERQGQLPDRFIVDSLEDNGLRGCHPGEGEPSCPLRAALELAAAARDPVAVHFDPRVFDQPRELVLQHIPEGTAVPLVIDAQGAAPVRIVVPAEVPWRLANGVELKIDPALNGARP